eukprot:Hpha_TRINITY_DN35317_c0_g1::TRINITY_DN35317_c0_g1_i1::g.85067::m.85067
MAMVLSLLAAVAMPTNFLTNGLGQKDAAAAPFPASGEFVLSWSMPSPSATLTLQVAEERASWVTSFALEPTVLLFVLPPNLTSTFEADTTYKWRLLAGGSPSEAVFFEVAPTEAALAAAKWLGGGSEVEGEWTPPVDLERARAYFAGMGLAELWVDGVKVGDHIADPGEAVYDERYLYVGFNITSLLKPGSPSRFRGRLGNGKWGYLDMFANRTAAGDQSGDATRAFQLLVTGRRSGGERVSFTTGEGWKVRHGPVVYDHLWHG